MPDTDSLYTRVNAPPLRTHRQFTPGWWYLAGHPAGQSVRVMPLDTVFFMEFDVGERQAFDRIGCEVTTVAAAGGVARLGLYTNSIDRPDALVGDFGTVDTTILGAREIVIAQTLDPGLYWLAVASQVAACSLRTIEGVSNTMGWPVLASENRIGWLKNPVPGALPNPANATMNQQGVKLQLRAA